MKVIPFTELEKYPDNTDYCQIHPTEDGSLTIYSQRFNEHFHSVHGALQESRHIFIAAGLCRWREQFPNHERCKVFELGFGTGLNAALTAQYASPQFSIEYYSVELYPLMEDIYSQLHYDGISYELLQSLHQVEWNSLICVNPSFELCKIQDDFLATNLPSNIDLIYFDAFSPNVCPKVWSERYFMRLFEASSDGAVLITYCAKGNVRRGLANAGWTVERLPGPPGKREILRAVKIV